jgi:hypothetical protein
VPDRNLPSSWKTALAVVILLLCATSAPAYVGPGAGLELVGYSLSLLAWIAAAFSAVLLYPVYALLRRLRRGKNTPTPAPGVQTVPEEDRVASPADQ